MPKNEETNERRNMQSNILNIKSSNFASKEDTTISSSKSTENLSTSEILQDKNSCKSKKEFVKSLSNGKNNDGTKSDLTKRIKKSFYRSKTGTNSLQDLVSVLNECNGKA